MHPDLMLYMGLIILMRKDTAGVDVVMAALRMGAELRELTKTEEDTLQRVVDLYFI